MARKAQRKDKSQLPVSTDGEPAAAETPLPESPASEAPALGQTSPLVIGIAAVAVVVAVGAGLWIAASEQEWATDATASAEIRARVDRLETVVREPRPAAEGLRPIEDRLNLIEREVEALRRALAALGDQAETTRRAAAEAAALSNRVGRLEQAAQTTGSPGLALAVARLRSETATSRPFQTSFEVAKALAADPALAPAMTALETRAATGVATVDELAAQFPAMARDLARARPIAEGGEWWERPLAWLEAIVSVRRTSTDDPGLDGTIARAEVALRHRDLRVAVAALSGLDGRPAAVAATWLEAARARIAVDAAVDTLERRALLALKPN